MKRSQRADVVILDHVGFAATAGVIPVPLGDVLAVTAVQMRMLTKLAEVYDQPMSARLGRSFLLSLTGSTLARLGASAIKAVPLVGPLIGVPTQAALAGASTYAVGHVLKAHLAAGNALDTFDPQRMRALYESYLRKGREFVEQLHRDLEQDAPPEAEARAHTREPRPDSVYNIARTLARLSRLRSAGQLSPKEYDRLKHALIERVYGPGARAEPESTG